MEHFIQMNALLIYIFNAKQMLRVFSRCNVCYLLMTKCSAMISNHSVRIIYFILAGFKMLQQVVKLLTAEFTVLLKRAFSCCRYLRNNFERKR